MAALLPTTRTARIVALAAPLALAVALIAPAAWLVVPVAAGVLFLLVLIDAARAGRSGGEEQSGQAVPGQAGPPPFWRAGLRLDSAGLPAETFAPIFGN
mgnify:CR=1 FL=1